MSLVSFYPIFRAAALLLWQDLCTHTVLGARSGKDPVDLPREEVLNCCLSKTFLSKRYAVFLIFPCHLEFPRKQECFRALNSGRIRCVHVRVAVSFSYRFPLRHFLQAVGQRCRVFLEVSQTPDIFYLATSQNFLR